MKEMLIFTGKYFNFFILIICLITFFISIDDPLKKNATIGFINNFGQIPKQLFKKPHPSKKQPNNRTSMLDAANPILSSNTNLSFGDKLFFYHLDNLKPSLQPIKG
jgi:hypothetical protein